MSGVGAPSIGVDGSGLRVAVVSASWHAAVMDGLRDGARRALAQAGVDDVVEVVVPGTFELPVAAARLAGEGRSTRWSRSASWCGAGRRTSSTCATPRRPG